MSAKIAVVIGDYSNGWGDSIFVQQTLKFSQKNLEADREKTMKVLTSALLTAVKELEADDNINPKPKDEPCCEHFVDFANKNDISKMKMCPLCGSPITKERHSRFDNKSDGGPF